MKESSIKSVEVAKQVTSDLLAKYPQFDNVIDFIDAIRANNELASDGDYLIVWGRASRVLKKSK